MALRAEPEPNEATRAWEQVAAGDGEARHDVSAAKDSDAKAPAADRLGDVAAVCDSDLERPRRSDSSHACAKHRDVVDDAPGDPYDECEPDPHAHHDSTGGWDDSGEKHHRAVIAGACMRRASCRDRERGSASADSDASRRDREPRGRIAGTRDAWPTQEVECVPGDASFDEERSAARRRHVDELTPTRHEPHVCRGRSKRYARGLHVRTGRCEREGEGGGGDHRPITVYVTEVA